MSALHELKVEPPFFDRLLDGTKTFEVRKDDRGFQSGDTLVLKEWDRSACDCGSRWCTKQYTGRELTRIVGFIFKQGFGCDLGPHVVLSLLPIPASVLSPPTRTGETS